MRIAAEIAQEALHHGQDQLFVRLHEPAEEGFGIGARPVVLPPESRIAVQVERAAAEDPAFDQVGMDAARLLDGKVSLVDRAVPLRAEAQLVGRASVGEELLGLLLGVPVERGTDAVALEDGEAQRSERRAQLARERLPVRFVSVQEPAQVAGLDARLVVECFLMLPLGQVVLLFLVDLVVADEGLVGGLDPLGLPIGHRAAPLPP